MKTVHVVGAAIVRGGACLVAQRSSTMSSPGKWEFPGGKVEADETPQAALVREIQEELGLDIDVGAFLGRGTAQVGTRLIALDVFAARVIGGALGLREHAQIVWATEGTLGALDWADADVPVLDAVREHLRSRS